MTDALMLRNLRARRERLIIAMADGVKTVRDQNGELLQYRDIPEMKAALGVLDAEIRRLSGPQPNVVVIKTSKGL